MGDAVPPRPRPTTPLIWMCVQCTLREEVFDGREASVWRTDVFETRQLADVQQSRGAGVERERERGRVVHQPLMAARSQRSTEHDINRHTRQRRQNKTQYSRDGRRHQTQTRQPYERTAANVTRRYAIYSAPAFENTYFTFLFRFQKGAF